MHPVPAATHAVRSLLLAATLPGLLALAGCAAEPTRCDSPGTEAAQVLIVAGPGDDSRGEVVLVKCDADRTVTIVDKNDARYGSLAEFQEENELFAPDERIYVPKNFPSLDKADAGRFETKTIPARVSTVWRWWLLGGAGLAVVAAAAVAVVIWRRRRRHIRESLSFSASLHDLDEDDPKPGTTRD